MTVTNTTLGSHHEHDLRLVSRIGQPIVGIVVPSGNESEKVGPLLERLADALEPLTVRWEVLFVDDSSDETPETIQDLMHRGYPARLIQRPPRHRHGQMAGAIASGIANTTAEVVVVMGANLRHPPEVVMDLVTPILAGLADVTVASRYGTAGLNPAFGGPLQTAVARGGRLLTHTLFKKVRAFSDPCSGFFAFRRSVMQDAELRPASAKILMEVLVTGNWSTKREVPYFLARPLEESPIESLLTGYRSVAHVLRLRLRAAHSSTITSVVRLATRVDRVIDVDEPAQGPRLAIVPRPNTSDAEPDANSRAVPEGSAVTPCATASNGVPFWALAVMLCARTVGAGLLRRSASVEGLARNL